MHPGKWKYSKILRTLALAVSLSLLVTLAIPATPALAQSITLSITSLPGITDVVVTGEDFYHYRNDYVYLYLNYSLIKGVKVSETGTFTTRFFGPSYAAPGTSYYVSVRNKYGTELVRASLFVTKTKIKLDPDEGKIGDWVELDGSGFTANKIIYIYFSSDEVNIGNHIDDEVTAYENIGIARIEADGEFDTVHRFRIPDKLVDGEDKEDVHGDVYYVYVAYYFGNKSIVAVDKFVVIDGEIELDPDKSQVGTEVEISGKGFRTSQKVTIKYDGNVVDIASGDGETDSDGKFSCTIIIPESTAGNHTITVIDESGKKLEAEFSVESKVTIDPTSVAAGNAVTVHGTGFGENERVTITLDDDEVFTTPTVIHTNHDGSFDGSFVIPSYPPFYPPYTGGSTSKVEARDESFNVAEAQLTILATSAAQVTPATPAGISLYPTTSPTSPGHVGMELTADGTSFRANAIVTITYSNREAITVATATTDANGNFSATFTTPPSLAGDHTITSTDGTNSVTSIFIMESEAPSMPVPSQAVVVTTPEARAYFDWEDVEDASGVTYTFQAASDSDFTTIVLEEKGLTDSQYTITREMELESTTKEAPYYWRVKAVDGASNESEWTPTGLFYVGLTWTSTPGSTLGRWVIGISIGIGLIGLLVCILGFWLPRRTASH